VITQKKGMAKSNLFPFFTFFCSFGLTQKNQKLKALESLSDLLFIQPKCGRVISSVSTAELPGLTKASF